DWPPARGRTSCHRFAFIATDDSRPTLDCNPLLWKHLSTYGPTAESRSTDLVHRADLCPGRRRNGADGILFALGWGIPRARERIRSRNQRRASFVAYSSMPRDRSCPGYCADVRTSAAI